MLLDFVLKISYEIKENKRLPQGSLLFQRVSCGITPHDMAPPAGIEPATKRLTVVCSTAELQGNVI